MSEKDYRLNQEVYPYTKFPNFLFDLDLKANELALVLALIKYQSCETVTVGHKKLSELSGTHVNTVKNTLLSLKEKRLLIGKRGTTMMVLKKLISIFSMLKCSKIISATAC